jgi:hypothetical protein
MAMSQAATMGTPESVESAPVHAPSDHRLVTALLACGVAVAVVQIGGDVLSAALYPGYSYAHQTVSELSAIGAPTRPLQAAVGFVYEALVLAFAAGVWRVAVGKRSLRVSAVLLGVFAFNALVWGLFPMQQRGSELATTDVAHAIGAAVQVFTIVLFIGFGSGADGRRFRLFSIALIVAILAAGALTGTQAGRIAAGAPTPYVGLIERVSFYGPSVWILALAIDLLRQERERLRLTGATRPNPTSE